MEVVGALLSAPLQVLLERMASSDIIRGKKLNDGLLKKLKIKLLSVNSVINDAEEKQFRNPLVKEWLHELKDAVHDAEDLLDEIATEDLGCKLEAESGSSTSDQVRDFMSSSLNLFDRVMVPKIEEILDRLEYIAEQKDVLGLKPGIGEKLSKRRHTTSLVDESDVYGRDDAREDIIKKLLSEDDVSESKICVIPIVGMGGIGKTTLAQLVYNNRKVEEHFDLKAWACVSEEFDILKLTNTVLKEVKPEYSKDSDNLNSLQLKLKEELKGKKFLLVLDDVWNEKYDDWEELLKPFISTKQGSKIIVTTRNKSIASVMCNAIPIYNLRLLSNEDCWLLFAKRAFAKGNSATHPRLEEIGRDMVKKCNGLPLALKTLGSLLRFKLDEDEWNKILKSEIWELSEAKSNILPALGLSYSYLPLYLKPCFAYCSVFPKDWNLKKEELIQLWMAQGFLDSCQRNKRMEEVGDEYFDELVSRSFFQHSSNEKSHFIMHDLIHDLAQFVSGELHFRVGDDNSRQISKKTRHLSYNVFSTIVSQKLENIHNAKCLHTFLPLYGFNMDLFSTSILLDLLLKVRCLRVLRLSYKNLSELPDSIGTLRHLRYLDLSFPSIVRLPDSINTLYNLQTLKLSCCDSLVKLPFEMGKLINLRYLDISWCSKLDEMPDSVNTLYNLQTLKLSFCSSLVKLPLEMGKLINLRYLDISECSKLDEMPAQMSKLESLQMLSTFIVGKESRIKIGELGQLSNLRGTLRVKKLNNVANAKDASEAKLKNKKYLQQLHLEYDYGANTKDSLLERDVLEKLVPHSNLKVLMIKNYGGTRFPDWLGEHSFCNMVSLRLTSCKNCCILPPLGQLPSLKYLFIRGFQGVQTVGHDFYGNSSSVTMPFPSLEILKFEELNGWQEWCCFGVEDEGRAFPLLRELYIKNCQRLTGSLPQNLPSLTKLVIRDCKQLVSSLPRVPAICELELIKCEKVGLQELITYSKNCLQHLRVSDCSSFVSFHGDCLPTTLKTLHIRKCEKFRFPVQQYHTSLEELSIENISDTLNSFALDNFPNLNGLSIKQGKNLESLSVSEGEGPHRNLTSLARLEIFKCPNFVSFPKGGLPASNLTQLNIKWCDNLKSLPERMHILLPSLKFLNIHNCPELDSFPEGGLPSNLSSLTIGRGCDKLIARRMDWHLQSLPSLTWFRIFCENVESFPEEGLLPSTLTRLDFSISRLKTLDNRGLQHLTSLRTLIISNCPNLQSMPQEGLPPFPTYLSIEECPLLKERCQREKGEDWPKIAHISHIEIDYRRI